MMDEVIVLGIKISDIKLCKFAVVLQIYIILLIITNEGELGDMCFGKWCRCATRLAR